MLTPNDIRLDGKVAVVTGGGAGIGRGIAKGFAAFGAQVAIWERDAETCAAAADEVGGLGVHCDVRVPEQVDAAMVATLERFDAIDILVNNAGGTFRADFLDTNERGWEALHRANLGHVYLCTHRVAGWMVEQGRPGSIINITSIEGVRAAPGFAAYAAAKAGVINFTKSLALELGTRNIRVNALAPDITLTEGIAELSGSGLEEQWAKTVPMGRVGDVDEMAGAAIFLASPLSSYVTGETIHVDGGTNASSGWYHHPEDDSYIYGPPS